MKTETLTNCPSCKSSDFQQIGTIQDYFFSQKQFPISSCNNCTLVFTQNRPTAENIGEYYDSKNYASHDSSKGKSIFFSLYKMARNFMISKKHDLIRPFKPEWNRVLDYGAGEGHFVEYLNSKGKNAIGVEPSETGRINFEKRTNTPLYSDIQQVPKELTFQVITLWHVLEHIHTLRETIQELVNKLESKGIMVIAVPNQASKDRTFFGDQWAAWDVPRHLYHWGPQSLDHFMKSFSLVRIHTGQLPLDPFYIGLISARYAKKSAISGIWNGLKSYLHGQSHENEGSTLLTIWMKN
jgi:2-polyprenyl-3-methyl-5-hydroxy-6-metoxy-1,4-benzoquinol methylase